ncbi:hypothetical protein [Nocardioides sp. GY 10127]|uniref:hypothetical protein n=1 Tax=Nocardioides sp. GY 10127 TaxID=2569762 RepID=UPI0010A7694E|nr:hypothetical protein [Nocardioides sp. GY 10127]TIC80808.1 hypothetical protein E8D37_13205 [Nocardioides sp. GY 10127]
MPLAQDPSAPVPRSALTALDPTGAARVHSSLDDQADCLDAVARYVLVHCSDLDAFSGLAGGVRGPYAAAFERASSALVGVASRSRGRAAALRRAADLLVAADDTGAEAMAALRAQVGDPEEYGAVLPRGATAALATGDVAAAATASEAAHLLDRWRPSLAEVGYASVFALGATGADLVSSLGSIERGAEALRRQSDGRSDGQSEGQPGGEADG